MTLQEAGPIIAGVGVMLTLIWNIYQATVGRQKADAEQNAEIAILKTEIATLKSRIAQLEQKLDNLNLMVARTETLEVKMGLFWHLIEDNMSDLLAKANPINLTPEEKAAALVYKTYRSQTPTKLLKKLDLAITREMPNLDADERPGFTLVQAAIKNQLVDRGEYPNY